MYSSSGSASSNDDVYASCTSSEILLGGGYSANNPTADVNITYSRPIEDVPSNGIDSWQVIGTGTGSYYAYAICAST